MSTESEPRAGDEMLDEYDFSSGVRGKYAERYAAGHRVVVLPAEDADATVERRSSWKGKALELLIAAKCMLGSDGKLNVSMPLVDDDGVDLVFSLRGLPAALAVQVKARFRPGAFRNNTFRTQVRRATFRPRSELALLFVLYDSRIHDLETAWLVPSFDFEHLTGGLTHPKQIVFAASITGQHNVWTKFRRSPAELPAALITLLECL